MPCPVCDKSHSQEKIQKNSSEHTDDSCEFICDTGKKCKKDPG